MKKKYTTTNKEGCYKTRKYSLQWWWRYCRWRWDVEARSPGGSLVTADGTALLLETDIDFTLETNVVRCRPHDWHKVTFHKLQYCVKKNVSFVILSILSQRYPSM